MHKITIIDYGIGNILSVQRGFEHFGVSVNVTSDPDVISNSSKIVLPGVGAFGDGILELERLGLITVIKDAARHGIPILGICLGMQLLFDESEEFGINTGLGLIPGRVVPIPSKNSDGEIQKLPHIGWSELVTSTIRNDWQQTLLHNINPGEAVYFVHSYMAIPLDSQDRVADSFYGGISISAVVNRDNIFGCQFHPEKSGEAGLEILHSFIEL